MTFYTWLIIGFIIVCVVVLAVITIKCAKRIK